MLGRLSTGQVSASFEHLHTYTFMYATPTLTTKAIHLATQVQQPLMTVTVNTYTVLLAYSYLVSFHHAYQCQATSISDMDYSCHLTAIELV